MELEMELDPKIKVKKLQPKYGSGVDPQWSWPEPQMGPELEMVWTLN